MTASANYKLTYGKTTIGAACKRGGGCVNERSPGKITLGQLRLDASTSRFTASYHLGCVSATTAANCLDALGGGETGEGVALERAVDALLEGLRPEHLADDDFADSTRDALETTLGSGKGSDGLNDEQRAFLEGVYDESTTTTKGTKKRAPATTSKAKPKSTKPAAKKSAAAKSKSTTTTKKRGAKAAAASSKKTTKKRKTEESEEEDEEEDVDEEHAAESEEHESESEEEED